MNPFDLLNSIHNRGEWENQKKKNRLLVSDPYKMSSSQKYNERFNKKSNKFGIKLSN